MNHDFPMFSYHVAIMFPFSPIYNEQFCYHVFLSFPIDFQPQKMSSTRNFNKIKMNRRKSWDPMVGLFLIRGHIHFQPVMVNKKQIEYGLVFKYVGK